MNLSQGRLHDGSCKIDENAVDAPARLRKCLIYRSRSQVYIDMLLSNPFLLVHIIAASAAVPLGAVILTMHKGTATHRAMGYGYFLAMIVANLSILPIEARVLPIADTRFGIFHILALVSLGSMTLGAVGLIRWRRTGNIEAMRSHQIYLGYSYLGLVMALVSELLVNPNLGFSSVATPQQFWTSMAVVNIVLYAVGSILIFKKLGKGDPKRFLPA